MSKYSIIFLYFIRNNNDAARACEKFLADSSPYGSVKRLRSDDGTEFTYNEFWNIAAQNIIKQMNEF